MTHLRKLMLDELQRRNYAQRTAESYVYALRELAAHYHLPQIAWARIRYVNQLWTTEPR